VAVSTPELWLLLLLLLLCGIMLAGELYDLLDMYEAEGAQQQLFRMKADELFMHLALQGERQAAGRANIVITVLHCPLQQRCPAVGVAGAVGLTGVLRAVKALLAQLNNLHGMLCKTSLFLVTVATTVAVVVSWCRQVLRPHQGLSRPVRHLLWSQHVGQLYCYDTNLQALPAEPAPGEQICRCSWCTTLAFMQDGSHSEEMVAWCMGC